MLAVLFAFTNLPCIDLVKNVFESWKLKCPEDDRYEMQLLYYKALGDCSESQDISSILVQVKETTCKIN